MTALAKYERLEAPGRYFDGETARPRDVIVKFGDASLIVLNHDDLPITHWSLASVRDLSSGRGALALTPDHDSDERLTVEDEDMIAAIREVCPDLAQRKPARRARWPKIAFWTAAALGSIYMMVFHLVPALSDQLATLIPPEAEIAMGAQMSEQFTDLFAKEGREKFCSTPTGDAALTKMVARFEPVAGSHVPLVVRVLDHPMVNAFALPGGQVVLFRGLLREADTPEEVAGVLAHEIGHVVARDPTRLTLRAAGSAGLVGLLLGDFTGATATIGLSEALLRSSYRREAETAADDYAIGLFEKERLPTSRFADFFLKLKEGAEEPTGLLAHLSTHPDLAGRAARTRAADTVGDEAFTPVLDDQEWVALRNICQSEE